MDISKRCVVVAIFTPKAGQKEAVQEILTGLTPKVHAEPGCEFYALHEIPDGRFCFVEAWETRELWVQHGQAASVSKITEHVVPLLEKPVEVLEMYGVPAGGDKGIIPLA